MRAYGTSVAASPSHNHVEFAMKTALSLLLLGLPLVAFGSDNPDASFFKDAAEAGMAEVDAGHIAQSKGTNPAVKEFGAMMVKDHTAANAKLKTLAQAKGVELPDSASFMQKAMNKKTDMKSGDSFDKDYIQGQIKAHQDTIDLLQKEIDSGQDTDAKAFAKATLPKVKSHLDKINKIATDAGVSN
jgi:putative membrane protein